MLKLSKVANGQVDFKVIGTMNSEEIAILRGSLRQQPGGKQVVLDLSDLWLVNREAVQFLAECEERGIRLLYPVPYIRFWIGREKALARRTGNS